jgi:hypothetical protein
MSEPANVLVVAHQTAATGSLIDAVRERAQRSDARFHLVVPRQPHGMHKAVDPHEAGENAARRVLADALPKLSEASGQEVTGSIGDPEPLKLDPISKTRALGLPVTHVLAPSDVEAVA